VVYDSRITVVVVATVKMFERETKVDENVTSHTTVDPGVLMQLRMDNGDDGDEESWMFSKKEQDLAIIGSRMCLCWLAIKFLPSLSSRPFTSG
jgi:hypothetical protein